ncbi:YnbE family lipoprotein [Novosphingobium sp. RD2P27]|uniref:YnbE family lipoprotein n=1 Tax=Novosphingobium kalidii TaxID=3230299 RepID=A0ABV2CYA9_9SPHN
MTFRHLTASNPPTSRDGVRQERSKTDSLSRCGIAVAVLLGGAMALAGCISVNAPDKPIVIELNINIKQEVIYRLAEDVKQNIEANPEIF